MLEELETLSTQAQADIASAGDAAALEAARIKYFGRQGTLAQLGERMKSVSKEERPAVGRRLNEVRQTLTAALDARAGAIHRRTGDRRAGRVGPQFAWHGGGARRAACIR